MWVIHINCLSMWSVHTCLVLLTACVVLSDGYRNYLLEDKFSVIEQDVHDLELLRDARSHHVAGAAFLAVPVATLVLTTAHFIYGLKTGETTKQQLREIRREIAELDFKINELKSGIQNLKVGQQWLEGATIFGRDVQRLTFLIEYLKTNLYLDQNGRFVRSQDAEEWADNVLSLGPGGIDPVLLNFHHMVMGKAQIFGQKPILDIYMDRLDPRDPDYWEKVDNFITFLYSIQVAGYTCWATAKNIKDRRNEIEHVQTLGKSRLFKQSELMEQYKNKLIRSWPEGTYGLVKPEAGCPGPREDWGEGYRFYDTEDSKKFGIFNSKKGGNDWSGRTTGEGIHIAGKHAKNNMEWHFCMKLSSEEDHSWPKGRYCVFKSRECPKGFMHPAGSIFWDDVDAFNSNKKGGYLPDGRYDGTNTRIYFCCRRDGDTNNPILLPTQLPFYLFPFGDSSSCQKVRGMSAKEEWFWWDEENTLYRGAKVDPHPKDTDTTGKNHKIHMCYYEKL